MNEIFLIVTVLLIIIAVFFTIKFLLNIIGFYFMSTNYYLILDQDTCWASGFDLDLAWSDLSEYIIQDYFKSSFDGSFIDYAKSLEITETDSINGQFGFFVVQLPLNILPPDFKNMDGSDWYQFYFELKQHHHYNL